MSILEKKRELLEKKIKRIEKLKVDVIKLQAQLAEPERTERNYNKYRSKYENKKIAPIKNIDKPKKESEVKQENNDWLSEFLG